jgi:RNA polymerase sigma factor for flagellar operon FliA
VEGPKDSAEVLERFQGNLDLVDIIARQTVRAVGNRGQLEDLVAYGREGLLEAARRFDPSRGVPFRSFANYRVRGAVLDGVRALCPLTRRTHARLKGVELVMGATEGALEDTYALRPPGSGAAEADQAVADHMGAIATAVAMGLLAQSARGGDEGPTLIDPGATPEGALEEAQLLQQVRDAIDELPPREAELIRRHYLQGDRFDLVAAELGLSKSWASRLHTRALMLLSNRLASS